MPVIAWTWSAMAVSEKWMKQRKKQNLLVEILNFETFFVFCRDFKPFCAQTVFPRVNLDFPTVLNGGRDTFWKACPSAAFASVAITWREHKCLRRHLYYCLKKTWMMCELVAFKSAETDGMPQIQTRVNLATTTKYCSRLGNALELS